ncbi:MAG: hypothetical protein ACXW5U_01235 [Thermoanaerobaculia bacterium]
MPIRLAGARLGASCATWWLFDAVRGRASGARALTERWIVCRLLPRTVSTVDRDGVSVRRSETTAFPLYSPGKLSGFGPSSIQDQTMSSLTFDPSRFKNRRKPNTQFQRQVDRLAAEGKQIDCIEAAVNGALANLTSARCASFVIYGEPQSGKTEMMICLTARLLDEGRLFVLHLLNDSVDLLGQNLGRFQKSGLAPAAKNFTDVLDPAVPIKGRQHVIFCKKNPRDLEKLQQKIGKLDSIVIVDDEADYASPNAKINQRTRTRINELISELLGSRGDYIGVTATPARLDLNNTFDNDSSTWVNFPTHSLYTGQDVFFPMQNASDSQYRLTLLPQNYDAPRYARTAFFGFLVNVAHLNTRSGEKEQNYSMLIHTSGKRVDHKADWTSSTRLSQP